MAVSITLTSSMRSNLYALKNLTTQMNTTQMRLATGLKVNTAIDNASSYYQARALNNRASDLNMLLDAMGQKIQTISTAVTTIDKAMNLFEQMRSIANDATAIATDDIQKIDSSMSTSEIQRIINKGGIVSLQDDIILSRSLNIDEDVTIIGNGHAITFAGTYGFSDPVVNGKLVNKIGESAINIFANVKISGVIFNYSNTASRAAAISIDGGNAEIDNLIINGTTSANRLYGIQILNGGKLKLDNTNGINLTGDYSEKIVNGNPNIWSGEYNTQMIVEQMGADNIAAYACNQFYVNGIDDENFGQRTWYLPSIGELCDMYGYNYDAIDVTATSEDNSGAIGDNKQLINAALKNLRDKGVTAAALTEGYYHTSSEYNYLGSWLFGMDDGERYTRMKSYNYSVRAFQLLEDKFADNEIKPMIGDVMYSDLSYGSANDYDSTKTAVGVVTWVSEDGSSAKIVNLKNLTVSVNAETEWQEFDPNDPYGGAISKMKWQNSSGRKESGAYTATNITNIAEYNYPGLDRSLSIAMACRGDIEVSNKVVEALDVSVQKYSEQFNLVLNSYNEIIEDSNYQGINLLNGGNMNVAFNEDRTHNYNVSGYNADANSLGIYASCWETLSDVKTSISQLQSAVASLRNIAESLGNSLAIIQTRENFTDKLIDVLQTGADDLVLADMNEESANYLALQTRNNLAVNALALAAQSGNAVLKLF